MSSITSIPFLENASIGKNNWWKYLLTVIISLVGASVVAGLLMVAFLIFYSIFLSYGGVSDISNIITSTVSNPFTMLILLGVIYALSFFLFYICLRFLHHKTFLNVINTVSGVRWKMLLKGLVLWLLILGILSLPDLILNPQGYQVTFNQNNFLLLLVLCLLIFPMQASFEEILFRGYLMQGFSLLPEGLSRFFCFLAEKISILSSMFNYFSKIALHLSKPLFPLLLTSIVFGCVHFFNGTSLYVDLSIVCSTFIIGLMLGIITLGDNGIETAMGIHIANNLYVSVLYNSTDSGLPGLPSAVTAQVTDPFAGLPFLALAALVMIVILFWNRKEDIIKIFR